MRDRAAEEDLIEAHLAVVDMAAGHGEHLLDIGRRQDLRVQHLLVETRGIAADLRQHDVQQFLPGLVRPFTAVQLVGHMATHDLHDVLAFGRHARIKRTGCGDPQVGSPRHLAVPGHGKGFLQLAMFSASVTDPGFGSFRRRAS